MSSIAQFESVLGVGGESCGSGGGVGENSSGVGESNGGGGGVGVGGGWSEGREINESIVECSER